MCWWKKKKDSYTKEKIFKYKAEICANYTGCEFYDKLYPVMIICPNTVEFKDMKLHLIEDVLHRMVPHRTFINKPEIGLWIIKEKDIWSVFKTPEWLNDNKVAAHTATKSIYKIEMPNVQFLKIAMPMKLEHYEVTIIWLIDIL